MDRAALSIWGQLTLALCIAAGASGCVATRFEEKPPTAEARAPRDVEALARVRAEGRDGDWLVIRGYHVTDNLVATFTNKPFSHAAVLDLERDQVIEAESQGVHVTSLADFVAKSHRLILVRPMWSEGGRSHDALAKARSVVGKRYDFIGLVGLDVPDAYYCSELAIEIYRPHIRPADLVPHPVEPGQLHFWGRILYDTGAVPG
jgi:hypothetical protein